MSRKADLAHGTSMSRPIEPPREARGPADRRPAQSPPPAARGGGDKTTSLRAPKTPHRGAVIIPLIQPQAKGGPPPASGWSLNAARGQGDQSSPRHQASHPAAPARADRSGARGSTPPPAAPAQTPPQPSAHLAVVAQATPYHGGAAAPALAPQPAPLPPPPVPAAAQPAHAPVPQAPPQGQPAPMPAPPAPMPAPPVPGHGPLLAPESRWAVFERLGLKKPEELSQNTRKLLVSSYRLLGFAILTIIVVVLVGYIATSVFYFASNSWVQPMVVSPSDEKVLQLNAALAEQANVRDRVAAELDHNRRFIAVQQEFQGQFEQALRADLEGRKDALERLQQVATEYAAARREIRRSNKAYARNSRQRMAREYAARLIDRSEFLSGKQQLAQIANSNLSLAERQAEFETRAAALAAETQSLDAVLSSEGEADESVLSYDVLRIKREYEMSQLETKKAEQTVAALEASLARHDEILEAMRQSPYLRAARDSAHVAFVPYDNLEEVSVGAPVYGCALGMIFCGQVGTISEIMPGEVSFKHPQREEVLRGRMLQLDLEEPEAARDDVLFVGGRPLLI